MVNSVGSARRDVRMSTSIAVQAPIAASSSSTGVNSPSDPVPTEIVPPVSFVTVYLPGPVRAMLTCRCPSCAISVAASPCRAAAVRPAGQNAGRTAAMPGHGDRLNEVRRAGVTARAPGTRWRSWTKGHRRDRHHRDGRGDRQRRLARDRAAGPRPAHHPGHAAQRGTTQRARGTARRGRERGMSLHDLFTQAGRDRARRRFRLRLARRGPGLPGLPGLLRRGPGGSARATARRRRRLAAIDRALAKETPRLASMFAMFNQLAAGEPVGAERLPSRTWPRPGLVQVAFLATLAAIVALSVVLTTRVHGVMRPCLTSASASSSASSSSHRHRPRRRPRHRRRRRPRRRRVASPSASPSRRRRRSRRRPPGRPAVCPGWPRSCRCAA